MIAFALGIVIGIPVGGALTLYALWKQGILTRDDFNA